jgi:hypothetical protein
MLVAWLDKEKEVLKKRIRWGWITKATVLDW